MTDLLQIQPREVKTLAFNRKTSLADTMEKEVRRWLWEAEAVHPTGSHWMALEFRELAEHPLGEEAEG